MRHKPINIELFKEHISYDSETGVFTRKRTGKPITTKCKDGYIRIRCKNEEVTGARLAWMMTTGEDPGDLLVDHINRIRTDNRISNLRLASDYVNGANILGRGITQRPSGRWEAACKHKGRYMSIGIFDCPLIARLAYIDRKLELWGDIITV